MDIWSCQLQLVQRPLEEGNGFFKRWGSSFCLIVCVGEIGPERCVSTEPEWGEL